MSDRYLQRDDAPFGAAVWEKIDETVMGAAKARLAGRRLLHIDGPHGLPLQAFGSVGGEAGGNETQGAVVRAPAMTPLLSIESSFSLAVKDIAAFEGAGQLLDLGSAAKAAAACADQEDTVVFNGAKAFELEGLLTAKGVLSCKLAEWKETGSAVDNIMQCVTKLDAAGFQGPYALALAPGLFNTLFRRYPQSNQTEIEHLRLAITDGIVKAAAIACGGVLVTAVKELASIVVGQDLKTAFVGAAGRSYEFAVSETAVLRLAEPTSVCVLR